MSYVIIFLAVLIEGPIATLTAAAMAAADPNLDILMVLMVTMVGNLTADGCWYLLGAIGKYGKILEYIPWLKNQSGLVQRASVEMRKQGIKVFVLTKLGFGLGSIPLLIAAGILNFNWRKLLGVAIITESVWTGTLCTVGYQAWANLGNITFIIEKAIPWVSVTIAACLLFILIRSLMSHSR
ncbi:DedA family protein [Desulfogranum japonicum]|uniref:DedA family protein n=1 Tax=Desulfogranum japonicum TaxID=231447 RepID=UPI0004009450|nr:VTT domain-containing protein [Desulfogranum japonicum]